MKKALVLSGFLIALVAVPVFSTMEDDLMEGKKTLLQAPIVKRTAMMMREQLPPVVGKVYLAGGNLVETSAEVGSAETPEVMPKEVRGGVTPPKPVKADLKGVRLYWSPAGGGGWKSSEFASSRSKPGIMDTKAPGAMGSGSNYSIRAWDSTRRVSVDLACRVKKWPPADSVWNSSCLQYSDGKKIEECLEKAIPSGCVFPLGADDPPVDDMPSLAGGDVDMMEVFAARDDKKLHIAIAVQREISPGSLTPVNLHQYGFVVMNPHRIAQASEDMIPHGGALVRYLPQGEKTPDFAAPCAAITNVQGKLVEDTVSVSCESRGGVALISMDLALMGENAEELIIIAHTGILSGFKLENFSFINMTSPVRIMLGERKLNKGEAVVETKGEEERKTGW